MYVRQSLSTSIYRLRNKRDKEGEDESRSHPQRNMSIPDIQDIRVLDVNIQVLDDDYFSNRKVKKIVIPLFIYMFIIHVYLFFIHDTRMYVKIHINFMCDYVTYLSSI